MRNAAPAGVALRKESVDRNGLCEGVFLLKRMSLSARRAWIEIVTAFDVLAISASSLSARRAWIEILFGRCYTWIDGCRSPQGERG